MVVAATTGSMDDYEYPFAKSEATRMLADAVKRAGSEKGWSQRDICALLKYKSSVVLSHMCAGRVAIPIERVDDFSRLLDMDREAFMRATLKQRYPDIQFEKLFSTKGSKATKSVRPESLVFEELESIAGQNLDQLPLGTINVLRAVVADKNPERRWLKSEEIQVVETIRKARPEGLTPSDIKKIENLIQV